MDLQTNMYRETYEHQYINILTILQGIPHLIKKSDLNRITKDLQAQIITLPEEPRKEDIILRINDINIKWSDIMRVYIHVDKYSPYSSQLRRRLGTFLRGRKFRWLIEKYDKISLQTQILELSRQGYK